MAKKFINWDNLEYIIESMQKFLIDHNGLDNHLDVFWEARERVTDNMKYGRDITGCTYTKEQYESLINPETSPYLEGTFVGVAEKNKSQDAWLNSHDEWLTAIEAKNVDQDGRLDAVESKNDLQDIAISNKADASKVYTKTETDSKIAEATKSILTGESAEQLNESYDTLLEIHGWIVSHGKEAADLLEAITTLSSRVEDIEKNGAGVDPNTTAKINDLRRVLDDIAHVEWDVNAWSESTEESSKEKLVPNVTTIVSPNSITFNIEPDDRVDYYNIVVGDVNEQTRDTLYVINGLTSSTIYDVQVLATPIDTMLYEEGIWESEITTKSAIDLPEAEERS